MDKIFIIDGNAIVYQSYYAFLKANLQTKDGMPIGALYGFIRKIFNILKKYKPEYFIVTFDSRGKKERHKIYEDYKANRKKMPDELFEQFKLIKEFLKIANIKTIEVEGYEADDVIGTLAEKLKDKLYVVVYTPDKDMLQLIDDNIVILKSGRKDDVLYDKEQFFQKYNFPHTRFVDYLAITGDSIDNIPGVKGLGPVGAKKLLAQFSSIEEMLANNEKIKNPRVKKLMQSADEMLIMSKKLVLIDKNVPLEIALDDAKTPQLKGEKLRQFLMDYNFNSLLKFLSYDNELFANDNSEKIERKVVFDDFSELINSEILLLKTETGYEICDVLSNKFYKIADITSILNKNNKLWIYDAHKFIVENSDYENEIIYDLRVLEYWYNYSYVVKDEKEFYEKNNIKNIADLKEIYDLYKKYCVESGVWDYVIKNELFFLKTIRYIEKNGIKVDKKLLREYEEDLKNDIKRLEKDIFELAGEEFNIRSSKQLGIILFEKMGLTLPNGKIKKTKTGYSTDEEVLKILSDYAPIAKKLLEYRMVTKILSTYITPYKKFLSDTTRIHTYFDYCGTATGRLASKNPNLQNIPVHGEWGNKMRKLFIAEKGYKLISADYSQMELRILAYFSQDETLKKIFEEDGDIHTETARHIFGTTDDEKRRVAKTINFGIAYGLSSYGLASRINMSRKEAEEYIKKYFERFPGVKKYIDNTINYAKEHGWVSVISGRRRYTQGINSKNYMLREGAKRIAINTPIQGSAADFIKNVMNKVFSYIKDKDDINMVLQIHDELLFEVKEEKVDFYIRELKNLMEESWFDISIKMKVDINAGNNWYEAH